ncbi:MAG TPA: histidine kinase [Vicinamibacterales bacterium]|nr:histidine kinase [Vicinamibacterales bacterium]
MRPTSAGWWIAAAGFWLLVSLLSVAQIIWVASRPGERINVTAAVIWQATYFLLWIPFTALVWWLAERWPLSRLGWPRFLTTHVAAALVVGAIQAATNALIAATWLPMGNESVWTVVVSQMRSRMPTQIVIYVAALATAHASLLYDRWRQQQAEAARLEAQLADARLGALRAQLHPHVLFNGLHAIAALVREGRNDDAVRLISGMGDLLRRFLDAGDARVSLADEVDLTRQYLAIQQVRFGDRLSVRLDVDPAAESARVPALIIQPLVENALRHGLSEKVEPGRIEVTARRDADELLVRVSDDGVGVSDAWDEGEANGTGLRNLRARLQAEYNGRASMEVRPGRDRRGGFDVELRLPWIDA